MARKCVYASRNVRAGLLASLLLALFPGAIGYALAQSTSDAAYRELTGLYDELIRLNEPGLQDGAPDYTARATRQRQAELERLTARLGAIDPSGWPRSNQVDYHLVRASLNGLDFHLRVLRPWARDPAFYASVRASQSDTPSEEGPTIAGAIRLWQYPVWPQHSRSTVGPLTPDDERRLAAELATVPPLLEQARVNLADSDAKDLWLAGIRSFRQQASLLERFAERAGANDPDLKRALAEARQASLDFADWLQSESPGRNGPSGVGRENYTWHLQNVLLVPRTWEEEVAMMRQELARAHAGLRLEEHRNRALPPLDPVAGPEAFAALQSETITAYIDFLDRNDVMRIEPWYDQALRERVFDYYPEDNRHFFHQATHRDPRLLWTHFYHYWDLARMEYDPHASAIRREALPFNVWMSRAEGLATVMEEWMMNLGLYADNPRAREIVWIMLATRAARGLSSLLAHANDVDMQGAGEIHVEWTPRDWMNPDQDLLGYEQHLYLRQPGYGTSYLSGARMLDETLALRARQLGDAFTLEGFFDEVNAAGLIPVSLLHWELTGDDTPLRRLLAKP